MQYCQWNSVKICTCKILTSKSSTQCYPSSFRQHSLTGVTAVADIVQKVHDQIQVDFFVIKTVMIRFQELSVFCTEVTSVCVNQRTFI